MLFFASLLPFVVTTTDAAAFVPTTSSGNRVATTTTTRANNNNPLHRRYALLDDIRGIGWSSSPTSSTSKRGRGAASPGSENHLSSSSPLVVEFQETVTSDTTTTTTSSSLTPTKLETEQIQSKIETTTIPPLEVLDLSVAETIPEERMVLSDSKESSSLPDLESKGATTKAIVVELENGTELFPVMSSGTMLSSGNMVDSNTRLNKEKDVVGTFSRQLPVSIRAWEVVVEEVDDNTNQVLGPLLIGVIPKNEDETVSTSTTDNKDLNSLDNDIGHQILQTLTGVRDDIKDMKASINETTKRYGELETRLFLMEQKLEQAQEVSTNKPSTTTSTNQSEKELVDPPTKGRIRNGWRILQPDPKEPFCSTSGAFLWIGSDRPQKTPRNQQSQQQQQPQQSSPACSPTMITGDKFAILLENQLEITKQLGFFISELRSVREVQEEQNSMLDTVSQSNLDLISLINIVKDDIAGVKSGIHGSLEQYNKLDGNLSGLEEFVLSDQDTTTTNLSLSSPDSLNDEEELPASIDDIPNSIDLDEPGVELYDGRTIFKPDPKAPFCTLDGKFIWIGTDVE